MVTNSLDCREDSIMHLTSILEAGTVMDIRTAGGPVLMEFTASEPRVQDRQ